MESHYRPDNRSAYQALSEAQKIAFAPFIFQAANTLLKLGILAVVERHGERGVTVSEICEKSGVSEYGVGVLLDLALSAKIVWKRRKEERFVLDKIGHFLLNNEMTAVNMSFTADVNYVPLAKLAESVKEGRAAGLGHFDANAETIYPILGELPQPARESWFAFDHFYSDCSFETALEAIFSQPVETILDIGGNTGKFALRCLRRDEKVHVVIMDLPQQLCRAEKVIAAAGFADRVTLHPCDVLDETQAFFQGADVIWMSQFLDCFSLAHIEGMLTRLCHLMSPTDRLYVLETFWDRQQHHAAALALNATSLYFTVLANGYSRMYGRDLFLPAVERAGFLLSEETDNIGIGGHTLMQFQKLTDRESSSAAELST